MRRKIESLVSEVQAAQAAGEEFVRQAEALKEDALRGREGESAGT